ncbi:MAG: hypothetical protein ABJP48_01705 [Erythrobacter sp.]
MVSLVSTDQDILMMLDGLVIDTDLAKSLVESRRLIACIKNDTILARDFPEDFERIDAIRAWGGIAAIRGDLVARLAEMPPDSDVTSLMIRIALQGGTPCETIDSEVSNEDALSFVGDAKSLQRRETKLIGRSAEHILWSGPVNALCNWIICKLAPRGLQTGPRNSLSVGLILLLASVGLSILGQIVTAISIAALGAFLVTLGNAWSGFRNRLYGKTSRHFLSHVFRYLPDVLIATLLCITFPISFELSIPIFAIGLARIAAMASGPKWQAFWRDRTLHMVGFAFAASFGQLVSGLLVFALMALGFVLMRDRGN